MADFALDFGQRFSVDNVEFEVVSIAANDATGETVFEVVTVEDADKRRERNKPEEARVDEVVENPSTAEVEAALEDPEAPTAADAPAAAAEEPEILHPRG